MTLLKLEHKFKIDIQNALLSSCKGFFLDGSVNFICEDGVVSSDHTVLILASKKWQSMFNSSKSDTDVVLTPDYSVNFIKNYLHSCIYDHFSIGDADENFKTSVEDGKDSLEKNLSDTGDILKRRTHKSLVCLEKNMGDDSGGPEKYTSAEDGKKRLEKNKKGAGKALKRKTQESIVFIVENDANQENPCVETFKVKEKASYNICLKTFSRPSACREHIKNAHS